MDTTKSVKSLPEKYFGIGIDTMLSSNKASKCSSDSSVT